MTTMFVDNPVIQQKYGLTPGLTFEQQFSKVSLENLIFYIVAVSIWTVEKITDIAIRQQTDYIKQIKIHSFTWYSLYAKNFQYGYALPWGAVEYADIDEDAKVVKFASCVKVPGGLLIKIAGVDGSGGLAPIPDGSGGTADMFTPFKEYMFRVSAAGDNLSFVNDAADAMRLTMTIYYDALVLDADGKRLDGSNDTPVKDAVEGYIKSIDFDSKIIPQSLVDALQLVEGVKVIHLGYIATKYGVMAWMPVPASGVTPFSGYARVDYNNPVEWDVTYVVNE